MTDNRTRTREGQANGRTCFKARKPSGFDSRLHLPDRVIDTMSGPEVDMIEDLLDSINLSYSPALDELPLRTVEAMSERLLEMAVEDVRTEPEDVDRLRQYLDDRKKREESERHTAPKAASKDRGQQSPLNGKPGKKAKDGKPAGTSSPIGSVTVDGITLDDHALASMDKYTFAAFVLKAEWEEHEACEPLFEEKYTSEQVQFYERAYATSALLNRHRERRSDGAAIEKVVRKGLDKDSVKYRLAAYRQRHLAPSTTATEGNKLKSQASAVPRKNPSRLPYRKESRGHFLLVHEWVLNLLRERLRPADQEAEIENGRTKLTAVGNLIVLLARLVYWSEQAEGKPPRADKRFRVEDKQGIWWLVFNAATLGKYLVLSKKAVVVAAERLADLEIVELVESENVALADGAEVRYGPNTRFVRIRWEQVEPVLQGMSRKEKSPRRGKREK